MQTRVLYLNNRSLLCRWLITSPEQRKMAKPDNNKVTESQAAEVHALTVQILELQAKQMLLTGEIDNAGVRNLLVYLKQQDVTVDPEEDPRTISLMNALKYVDLNEL